ncbi:MAG: 50S ribosomal protein L11 methyltransferase [Ignavibacteria bacterium]|nr:50S ribosomal protein L11 methyltransferase [Ignavibacteria bacterium]
MNSNYFEITIPFNKDNFEQIENTLYYFGIENILEENGVVKIYIEDNNEELIEKIKSDLKNNYQTEIKVEKFTDKNWNAEWENSIQPVYIKDKIVIHSSWNKDTVVNPEEKILIEIDPKMSFGTGHNETTQIVLEMLCEYLDEGDKTMLDFGAGTAVLSIAAAKLGIENIMAIEIDVDSIENAKEYIRNNGVEKHIKLDNCNISHVEESDFDVIAANIIRSVITANLKHIHSKLKSGGKLFISGILIEEEELLINELQKFDIEIIEVRKKTEWLGVYARKK